MTTQQAAYWVKEADRLRSERDKLARELAATRQSLEIVQIAADSRNAAHGRADRERARARELAHEVEKLRAELYTIRETTVTPVQRKAFEISSLGRPLVERAEKAEAEVERLKKELAEELAAQDACEAEYEQRQSWMEAEVARLKAEPLRLQADVLLRDRCAAIAELNRVAALYEEAHAASSQAHWQLFSLEDENETLKTQLAKAATAIALEKAVIALVEYQSGWDGSDDDEGMAAAERREQDAIKASVDASRAVTEKSR